MIFLQKARQLRRIIMSKYECPCDYVYDPAEGDYENGIEAGAAFEDLPDAWVCPLCGAEKEFFEKLD
jgi:rubredoxin